MASALYELAKTGRSKCATTGEPIAEGSPRVGFEIWRMGRRCMTYQTPKAFFSRLTLSIAQDGRSKCKLSGAPIKAGDLKIDFVVGGAKGETPTSQTCKFTEASKFLNEVGAQSGVKFDAKNFVGFKALAAQHQKSVVGALGATKGVKKTILKKPAATKKQ
eukprot:TRINITY_DN2967_c0_g1_i4.p1 TRINITY_DN2967_c0_g1~~TRINITY_DN2967_c0_g1_i4.p1  ORF type:complete len:177 (+),score=42.70 TRINITY_DN2967_c0_g1_i4:51-533(+)